MVRCCASTEEDSPRPTTAKAIARNRTATSLVREFNAKSDRLRGRTPSPDESKSDSPCNCCISEAPRPLDDAVMLGRGETACQFVFCQSSDTAVLRWRRATAPALAQKGF